jgi:nitrogen regulatory protein PII
VNFNNRGFSKQLEVILNFNLISILEILWIIILSKIYLKIIILWSIFMHLVKRLEMMVDAPEMNKIVKCLEKIGVSNYTVIPNAHSKKNKDNDLALTGLENVYIISYCSEEQIKMVVENIKPILSKFGGNLYISDVMEVSSVHCVASL